MRSLRWAVSIRPPRCPASPRVHRAQHTPAAIFAKSAEIYWDLFKMLKPLFAASTLTLAAALLPRRLPMMVNCPQHLLSGHGEVRWRPTSPSLPWA